MKFDDYVQHAQAKTDEKPRKYTMYNNEWMKVHPGQIWRPISWCDRCKADITGGLEFNAEKDEALCMTCASGGDKVAFASIGIIFDG